MKKRISSLLLSLLLLLSLFASAVQPVLAASTMTASEDCVALLKKMEGFSKYPVFDYSQYTVGYGTACPSDKLELYRSRGITEEEADALFREHVEIISSPLRKFADSNNLTLSQNQFDALIMLTYNVGTAWFAGTSDLKTAVLNGDTGNDLIYYMSRWCVADNKVVPGLVKRRLAESYLFLSGTYSTACPSFYSYVAFDPNEGVCASRVQGYDASDPPAVQAVPTRSGYRFLGWYTELEGGQWITDLDTATAEATLYARWQEGDGNVTDNVIQGTVCSYKRRISSAGTLSVYQAPNAAQPFAQLNAGITVKIVADYVDSAGAKWGKMEGGGWINLGTTSQILYPAAKTVTTNVTVRVTSDYINVRSGAGMNYSVVGKVSKGDTLVISETEMVGNQKWGRYSGGWVCLSYTDYASASVNNGENNTEVIMTGTVVNCTSLRVRSGPGTNYITVAELKPGATVSISQMKTVGAAVWGKISNGWICLSYVKMNESVPETKPETTPETQPSEEPEDGEYGTVISTTSLNVRAGAGVTNKLVDQLSPGTRVLIYETKKVGGQNWGRIRQGWICMDYIRLDEKTETAEPEKDTQSGNTAESTPPAADNTMTGTIYNCDSLRIRLGAGTSYPQMGSLLPGVKVTILETKTVNGVKWGRISRGWISMAYVQLDNPSDKNTDTDNNTSDSDENSSVIIGTVNGTNSLRIRKGAGTLYAQVGSLTRGTQVQILEVTVVKGEKWGRIAQGWVCMTYIKTADSVGELGTINTESLRIRSEPGTDSAVVGSYNFGTQVEILETMKVKNVTWGRTNQGWICMSYVKK